MSSNLVTGLCNVAKFISQNFEATAQLQAQLCLGIRPLMLLPCTHTVCFSMHYSPTV